MLPGRGRGRPRRVRHRRPAGRHRASAGPAGRRGDRAQRLSRAADAPRARRGPPARRGGRDRGPALPAGRAGAHPDRVRDRHQREDHHGADDLAHPRPGRAARRDGHHGRGLLRRAADPRGGRLGPAVGRDGPGRLHGGGGGPGDGPRRHRPARPGLRPRRRRRGHQHHRRSSGLRRDRRPGRPDRRQGPGGRGDPARRHAGAQRRRPPVRRARPAPPRYENETRWSGSSACPETARWSWRTG